jgi:hypothetical protein
MSMSDALLVRVRTAGLVGLPILVAIIVLLGLASQPAQPTRIVIHGAFEASTVDEMAAMADALAVIHVTGAPTERWNAADGKRWGEPGRDSWIYRDISVQVVEVYAGAIPSQMVLRDVGGSSDGVELVVESAGALETGRTYLALLAQIEFPMRGGGVEQAWAPVRFAQGLFVRKGDQWVDPVQGLVITDSDLDRISELVSN